MRKYLFVLSLICSLGVLSITADAAPKKSVQKAKGGFTTGLIAGAEVSGSAETITGVSVSCGSAACTVALYDADLAAGAAANANGVFEINAAANTTAFVDLSAMPVRVLNGITAQSNGTADTLIVYTEQSP